jgi:hypothetical protein
MSIYTALLLFSFIILIYWIITELFTILFRFTGLPDERARFQVISLLTGCGYTTRESELFISNRSRRRLARITMLFGYVFNITIVSAFINVFLSLKLSEFKTYIGMLIPILAAAVIILFLRVPKIRAWGDRMIEHLARRVSHRGSTNTVLLLDYIGEDSIAQVILHDVPESLRDLPLSETGLKPNHNILVMLLERRGGKAEPPNAQTVFLPGDKLTVFGNYRTISKVFEAKERFLEND